jgi:hypothetical protein
VVFSFKRPLVSSHSLLYFADVCAGPGGFSEYVLWRKEWHAKGFGFTLKGACDFKLEDFFAAPSMFFEPYYGEICDEPNINKKIFAIHNNLHSLDMTTIIIHLGIKLARNFKA